MTWEEMFDVALDKLDTTREEQEEVKVLFDFPPDGRKVLYSITSVSEEGIVIRNNEVNRPAGHP